MDPSMIISIVLMVGVVYLFMIRPDQKRKKEAQELRNSLNVGEEITTIGGIVGTICQVKESTVVFETGADRVRLEIMKWAISRKGVQETTEPTK